MKIIFKILEINLIQEKVLKIQKKDQMSLEKVQNFKNMKKLNRLIKKIIY